ncbi:MAG TPA: hypothetical protein VIE39_11030, partial [Thermoanaerobaculia bacterium]
MIAPRRPDSAPVFGPAARRATACLLVAAAILSLPSCASRPAPISPREDFPFDPREGLAPPFSRAVEKGWRSLAAGDAARALAEFSEAPVDA